MNGEPFYMDAEFWVAASFVLLVILAFRPAAKMLTKTLDGQSQKIADELAEAQRLRKEAEETLATYQKRQQDSLREAESIIAETNREADKMLKQAEVQVNAMLEKRMKLAMEKISQAENKAIQEVQNHLIDVSVSVARSLIKEHLKNAGEQEAVTKSVTELQRILN